MQHAKEEEGVSRTRVIWWGLMSLMEVKGTNEDGSEQRYGKSWAGRGGRRSNLHDNLAIALSIHRFPCTPVFFAFRAQARGAQKGVASLLGNRRGIMIGTCAEICAQVHAGAVRALPASCPQCIHRGRRSGRAVQ